MAVDASLPMRLSALCLASLLLLLAQQEIENATFDLKERVSDLVKTGIHGGDLRRPVRVDGTAGVA